MMSRATLLLPVYQRFSMRKGAARARVEVRCNPGQHTQDAGAIEGHELRLLLARGAQIQALQPRAAENFTFHRITWWSVSPLSESLQR